VTVCRSRPILGIRIPAAPGIHREEGKTIMSELNIHELEAQHGELLPARETLGVIGNGVGFEINTVLASQAATVTAVQAVTANSLNSALAAQSISVG
jgi:hypothetical protein